ncbi:Lig chan domain containing protein [Asbolus verrucosus]|uniref:Lig chan domain containing protein n=1 Tax=Asbolus verrucosus TaxID=1661398 RepID=A0A482VU31_ASBVE|nr:Lig chan domain containing protein [Asbolus verrucosus]
MYIFKLLLIGSLFLNGTICEKQQVCLQTLHHLPIVVIKDSPEQFKNFGNWKHDAYWINLDHTNLTDVLQKWSKKEFFNARAKFLIFTDDPVNEDLFDVLAKFYIINVVIVGASKEIYTYFPYKYENIAKPDTTPVRLAHCHFSEKLPKFWRNTTVKLLTKCISPYVKCFEKIAGLEMDIIRLLQQMLQFDIDHVIDRKPNFGLSKENGTYSSSFRLLDDRLVDMAIGSFRSIGSSQYKDFDFTTNHMEDKLVWVVPKALPMLHWKRITRTFQKDLWLILLISTIIMAKIFQKISNITNEKLKDFRKSPFFSTFRLLVGGHLKQTPNNVKMRMAFIFWLFFCIIFNITFNSNLVNVFFGNFHMFQIDSFNDIVESTLDIGLTDDVLHILAHERDSRLFSIKKNIQNCAFGDRCLNQTLYHRNLVCCWGERSIKYRMVEFDIKGIHLIEDQLLFFYLMFYFVKGYPMVPQMSRIITRLKSAGFIQYIYSKIDHANNLWRSSWENGLGSRVLSFKQLEGPFYLLFVGCIGGLLVFCAELISNLK